MKDANTPPSGPRVAEDLTDEDNRVRVVVSADNLGLAGAVNRILPMVETPYLAVINPDVTPMDGWLEPLVEVLERQDDVAVACPLVLMEASGLVNSAGQHVHVTGLGFNRYLGAGPNKVDTAPHDVGGLHGAAFLIRTQLLETLGGWDDTGFLYHEDVALSWDVLLLGMRIVCVPASRVLHDYHLTMYPEKLYLLERNRWLLLLSHLSRGRLLAIGPALLLTELMVWGLALLRGPGFLRAKARCYRWLWSHRDEIAGWRDRVFSRPVYDAANLYRHTRWPYPLSQLRVLGGERGESARKPPGGLPADP
jgi:GT2 family glycosyltransferase